MQHKEKIEEFNPVNLDHSFENQNNFAMWGETRFIPLMGKNGIFDKCVVRLNRNENNPVLLLLDDQKILVRVEAEKVAVNSDLRAFVDKPVMEQVFPLVFINYLIQKRYFPTDVFKSDFKNPRKFEWMKTPQKLQGMILSVIDETYFAFSNYQNGKRKGGFLIVEDGKVAEFGFIKANHSGVNPVSPDELCGVGFKKESYIPNWGE